MSANTCSSTWRGCNGALDQQIAVAKARLRFGARALQGLRQLRRAGNQPHAAPAAAATALTITGSRP
jgi:hypothetical protein